MSEFSDNFENGGTTSLKNRYYLYNSKERLFEKTLEMYHRIVYHFRKEQMFNLREGVAMDTRQKIDELLDKITSEQVLKRIYRFVKYLYMHNI